MKDHLAAATMADTLIWALPDGRDVLLNLTYAAAEDDLPEAAIGVASTMLETIWNELMEQE